MPKSWLRSWLFLLVLLTGACLLLWQPVSSLGQEANAPDPSPLFLPLLTTPPGEPRLIAESGRTWEATTFVSETVSIYLGDVYGSNRPDRMKIWWEGTLEPATYEPYTNTIPIAATTADGTNPLTEPGGYRLYLRLLRAGTESAILPFTFFFLPNGDFFEAHTGQNLEHWLNISSADANLVIKDKQLWLGSSSDVSTGGCPEDNPPGMAAVAMDLDLPDTTGYVLRVAGTVHTADQNPDNSATYDAFEVRLDGQVVDRVSNWELPIYCDRPLRQVPVDVTVALDSYEGRTGLSLENHQRFDEYFLTYSRIDRVWIADGK